MKKRQNKIRMISTMYPSHLFENMDYPIYQEFLDEELGDMKVGG